MSQLKLDSVTNLREAFRFTVSALFVVALIGSIACGLPETNSQVSNGGVVVGVPDEEGIRLITNPESFYTIDDLTAVGFKKSKQFDIETVPGATDIWYGFFRQQDIEIRFYNSHTEALAQGVELAEVVIGKKAGQRDPLIPVVNLYPAYAVVGNTVMLCERQLSSCQALIDMLE
ncbi:MAG: hypothetical protein HQ477_00980 [Chloroflexi bacterium]|nr:hypothetical protein [Chloroflexota bacterium]